MDVAHTAPPLTTLQHKHLLGIEPLSPQDITALLDQAQAFEEVCERPAIKIVPALRKKLDKHGLDYDLTWTVGGLPFLTPRGELSNALSSAIKDETGLTTELSTTGGTSDGRFIAQICPQVVEFGPTNASIHKIDEHVSVSEIDPLKNIYRRTLENLLL